MTAQTASLPFAVPEFRASKLSVQYSGAEAPDGSELLSGRFYTLTHNDLTGDLFLTVGSSCNVDQISGKGSAPDAQTVATIALPDSTAHCHVQCIAG